MVAVGLGWWQWVWDGGSGFGMVTRGGGWWRRGGAVSPDVTAMGTGEAELQPQNRERDPRGGVRDGQPHEGGRTGGWRCPLVSPPRPLPSPRVPPRPPVSPQVSVAVELSVAGLEDAGDAITFQLQLRR